jgi:hypothetical protein
MIPTMGSETESRLRGSIEDQLRFEKLIAEVSARFINLETTEIATEIAVASSCLMITAAIIASAGCERPMG